MSTFTIPGLHVGRHSAEHKIRELKAQVAQLKDDNAIVIAASEDNAADLHRGLVRGCQDSVRIAQLEADRDAAVGEVKRLQQKVWRDAADKQRLRQAVINARPLITEVVQRLDRPFVSHVQLPYPVPVGRSTANDETQQLPIVDQPEPWPVYTLRPTPAA
ncbi:hypothetical protein ABT010_13180 [Streptomyces sp. NPDC002668]|uniref:hypothetical protein n=1 Tax=Streptomyces sp. NPDC002668 TaxID=3154422 RepID=UPI003333F23A